MYRKVLIDWFATTKGQILQQQEADFLKRSITVSCKQVIVQIGALGWENDYIDCSLYEQFYVVDDEQPPQASSQWVKSTTTALPFQSESVDMVILPHLLDFDTQKHQVLREVERILKPEAKLTVLGFNPWNLYINLQYLKRREKNTPWHPSLIHRTRLKDWLSLLNFETELAAGFNLNNIRSSAGHAEGRKNQLAIAAYAIKAIKRSYHLIPLTPVREFKPSVAMAKLIEFPLIQDEHNENN
ncbi:MAG: methyltransferase domain-containing protein [Methyloprofundus sp.]|nr:methyltransferase domain-containing protein [Methyloprofundus sp.]